MCAPVNLTLKINIMAETNTVSKTKIVPNEEIKEPNYYNVIYINDDVTSMEFVIQTLQEIFHYALESAHALTLRIHEEGSAVVATLPYEIAEQKGIEVTLMARQNGYPLQVKIEADT